MGLTDLGNDVRLALEVLQRNGITVQRVGEVALYLIKVPQVNKPPRYLTRIHRFTTSDLSNGWPAGTLITKIDESLLKWEPILFSETKEREAGRGIE